jgi:hypothetical protein
MPTVVAEPTRTVTPSRRVVLAKSFGNLTEALDHARSLATSGKGYRITVRGDAIPTGLVIQIADQDSIFGDGECGLTVVVSCEAANLIEVSEQLQRLRDESPFEPLPAVQGRRFAARFGADIPAVRAFVERLLFSSEDEAGRQYWTVISRARSANPSCR